MVESGRTQLWNSRSSLVSQCLSYGNCIDLCTLPVAEASWLKRNTAQLSKKSGEKAADCPLNLKAPWNGDDGFDATNYVEISLQTVLRYL